MKKLLLLFLGILCSLGMEAAAIHFLSDATLENGTYTWTFSETQSVGEGFTYVEVPSATSTGKVAFTCSTTKDDRFLYIYNNRNPDESRKISMKKGVNEISYTADDIYKSPNFDHYYLLFQTNDDYKYNGIKLTPMYTVTCNEATNGTVSTNAAAGGVPFSTEVTITATPDEGYKLATLSVKDANNIPVSVKNSKFTMPARNVTVSATFRAGYTVTYAAGDGTGEMTGGCYDNGETFTLPASAFTAPYDKQFDKWLCSVDGKQYAAGAQYTMTAAATTFTAQYKNIAGTIIKAEYDSSTKETTVTGSGTADVSLSSSGKLIADKYFGVKAATGTTFKTGDVVRIHFTAAGSGKNWFVFNSPSASAESLIYSSDTGGNSTDLQFTLTSDQSAIYLARDNSGVAPYGTWGPTLGYIEVMRAESVNLGGVKVAGETLAAGAYSVVDNVITLSASYSAAPTVALIQKTVFSSTDIETTDVAVTLGEASQGFFTGTATVGGTEYTVKAPVNTAPALELSETSATLTVSSYGAVSQTITLTGSNLTNGTYDVTVPENVTVKPASFTVADGEVNQQFTITASAIMSNAVITFAAGETSATFTLNAPTKTAKRDITEATTVSTATTWDWAKAGDVTVALSATTSPTNKEEFIAATIAEITNSEDFNSAALTMNNAQYPVYSKKYFQGNEISFTTSVPGIVTAEYSHNSATKGTRTLFCNDSKGTVDGAEDTGSANSTHRTVKYTVNAGLVKLDARQTGTFEDIEKPFLRIYKITFTPTVSVTISDKCYDTDKETGVKTYYSTFSTSKYLKVPADVTVSEVGVENGKLKVASYQTGDIVDASRGLMISSSTPGKKYFEIHIPSGTGKSDATVLLGKDNLLVGTLDGAVSADDMAYEAEVPSNFYRLTMHNGTQIGFWWGAENGGAFGLAANKAFLVVPKSMIPASGNAKTSFWLDDNSTTTSLNNVNVNAENGAAYNLAGQRVKANTKGIVIMNGKKYVNK